MNEPQTELLITAILLPVLFLVVEVAGRRSGSTGGVRWWARAALYLGVTGCVVALMFFPGLVPFLMVGQLVLLGALISLIVGVVVYFRVVTTRLNRMLLKARELCEQRRPQEALDLLQGFLESSGKRDQIVDGAVLLTIADIQRSEKRMSDAHATLDRAMQVNDAEPGLFTARAELLREEGQTDAARDLLRDACSRFPKSVQVHTVYAEVLTDLGEYDAAVEPLGTAEQLLEKEKFVDVLNRTEWREQKLKPIRETIEAQAVR